jgi:serine phosphatase RsbU (regulator of sigma subunit)
MMRALVQELSTTFSEPGALLAELNRHLSTVLRHADPVMFATASYLVITPDLSHVAFANAGHPPPIHLRRNRGEASPICRKSDSGPALGLFERAVYKTCESTLAAGDCIMLFTDGLFEVEAANEELYTQERLRNAMTQQIALPAEELLNKVLAEVRQFSSQANFTDDICLVAIEVTGVSAPQINTAAFTN